MDGTATVVAGSEKYSGDIVIPADVEYEGKTYRVTAIGDKAFYGCGNLTSITIPENVTSIGSWAFYCCANLTSITIPASVMSIENAAFWSCLSLKNIKMESLQPPSLGISVLQNLPSNYVINVPQGFIEAYRASEAWQSLNLKEYVPAVRLADGKPFANTVERPVAPLTYTRTFVNTDWQALYVPFALEYADWAEDFDVARIQAMHQYDDNEDGEIDRSELEVVHLKEGSRVEANTPYVIRAHAAGTYTFELTETTLAKAEESTIDCRSVTTEYIFAGTYAGVEGADMLSGRYYALVGGELKQAVSDEASLGTFRWYMQAVSRTDGGSVTLPARIKLRVIDGNGTATGIDAPELAPVASPSAVYTLDGRRVKADSGLDGQPKGIYIVDGKKVMR